MGKKQRETKRNAKAKQMTPSNAAPVTTGSKMQTTMERGPDGKSTFTRFPREVRDRIYEELLVRRLSTEDQAKYDQVIAATANGSHEYECANAMDYFEQGLGIMPGSAEKYPFIVDALGLLLTNKQIHEEANSTLYSKNTFIVLVEWERVHSFWRCERADCDPPGMPCFVMFDYFKKIKHLYILLTNRRGVTDPMLRVESARLETNLKTVVECFLMGGNKLKTLKIRYTSCFDGQIDAVRDEVEGELPEGMPDRPIMMKDAYGKYHQIWRAEAKGYLFRHGTILEPLRRLRGIADDFKIRGDLPQAYMDRLTKTLSSPEPPAAVKKKLEQEAADRKQKTKPPGIHDFAKEMLDKHGEDGPGADLYRQLLRTSVKSPAVMADLMKPPTKEEMERFRVAGPPPPPPTAVQSTVQDATSDDDDDGDDVSVLGGGGGIGVLNGKPVFGPVRPPPSAG